MLRIRARLFRAGKELGFKSPVWQRGFSELRVFDAVGCARVREYIERNPVKRGLALNPAEYVYSSANGVFKLDDVPQGQAHIIAAMGRHV